MTAASQIDPGVQYLEDKLSILTRGTPDRSRNAALDILTGRAPVSPTAPLLEAPPHVARPATSTGFYVGAGTSRGARRLDRWAWVLALALTCVVGAGVLIAHATAAPEEVAPTLAEPEVAPAASPVVEAAHEVAVPVAVVAPPQLAVALPQPAVALRVLFDERFASNQRNWPNDRQGTAWLGNGAYHLAATAPSHFVAIGIPGTADVRDTVLTASFHKGGGPAGGGYGLILRNRDADPLDGYNQFGHYYVFEVGDRGQVGVWLRDGDRWVDLLTWSASDAVQSGTATNELTVSASGDHLSFLVNGIPVASQVDDMLPPAGAGTFVGGDANQVSLEHLTIRVPS